MNDNTVAIAALGVLATCVGLMAWVVKKVLGEVAPALTKHAETAEMQAKSSDGLALAVDKNTESNSELLQFMKRLNGKLEGAVIQKIAEQHTDNMTVDNLTVNNKE